MIIYRSLHKLYIYIASELWLCCELHMESDDVACLYNNRLHF